MMLSTLWCGNVFGHGTPKAHFCPTTMNDPCMEARGCSTDPKYEGGHGHIDSYDDHNNNREWDLGEETSWGYWDAGGYAEVRGDAPDTGCGEGNVGGGNNGGGNDGGGNNGGGNNGGGNGGGGNNGGGNNGGGNNGGENNGGNNGGGGNDGGGNNGGGNNGGNNGGGNNGGGNNGGNNGGENNGGGNNSGNNGGGNNGGGNGGGGNNGGENNGGGNGGGGNNGGGNNSGGNNGGNNGGGNNGGGNNGGGNNGGGNNNDGNNGGENNGGGNNGGRSNQQPERPQRSNPESDQKRRYAFQLDLYAGWNFVHIPLEVTQVDEQSISIETLGDLFQILMPAHMYIHDGSCWVEVFGDSTEELGATQGVVVYMEVPLTVNLVGSPLPTNFAIQRGLTFVGLPRQPPTFLRKISDFFTLYPKVCAVLVT